jgi:hypothetical protein
MGVGAFASQFNRRGDFVASHPHHVSVPALALHSSQPATLCHSSSSRPSQNVHLNVSLCVHLNVSLCLPFFLAFCLPYRMLCLRASQRVDHLFTYASTLCQQVYQHGHLSTSRVSCLPPAHHVYLRNLMFTYLTEVCIAGKQGRSIPEASGEAHRVQGVCHDVRNGLGQGPRQRALAPSIPQVQA